MSRDGRLIADRVWKRFRTDRNRALLRDEVARLRAARKGSSTGWRWALQDVSLEVEPGDSFALVGANGSGKSTMLKILVGVMFPYAGRVETTGRIGAMIAVSAGIHPELTARENVYMYGTLLGLTRKAVAARFDEIVAFGGLEEAVDRQVKFYSSGMMMRLGFAVNAYLDPDILIVDEVLAVGDAEFQQRCLARMRDVLEAGTTLVYVSHDLATVEAMCKNAMWLDRGAVRTVGSTRDVLSLYRHSVEHIGEGEVREGELVRVLKVEVTGSGTANAVSGGPASIAASLVADVPRRCRLVIGVSEGTAAPIFVLQSDVEVDVTPSRHRCQIEQLPLPAGRYSAWVAVLDEDGHDLVSWHSACQFWVQGEQLERAPTGVVRLSPVFVPAKWET